MNRDEKFMQLALKLAWRGGRAVAPNPMVGAVIVKNGRIIGEGWHKKFGGPHAEVNAIRSVRRPSDLRGATLYVTLEPCRHWGKTPPCADLIAAVGISRVVCGSRDPFQRKFKIRNPKFETNTKFEILNSKQTQRQCQELNKFYFMWIAKKRPYITVKIAVSADGFIATPDGQPVHITNRAQDRFTHKLRSQHQAIMVGVNTVLKDNPHLGVRLAKGEDPLRVILDSCLRIPRHVKVLRDNNYLIATCVRRPPRNLQTWVSPTQKHVSLPKLFVHLAKKGISSVLVEPGPTLYLSLKKAKLIDELIILVGKKKIGQGLKFFL